jgi:SAM-dependent methyltransferase
VVSDEDTGGRTYAVESWDREYTTGRYLEEPPIPFTSDILSAARSAHVRRGLYVGCGNGRNYLPLVRSGLDLIGLDISPVALQQLAERAPDVRDQLHCGDVSCLPSHQRFDLIIGIQVFQHGTREAAHTHIRAAQHRVAPGGLFAIRVNAVGTNVNHSHQVLERAPDGGYTVRYHDGPKNGLAIHFFSQQELSDLFAERFTLILPLRIQTMTRQPPARGQWSQWEAIWQHRPHGSGA